MNVESPKSTRPARGKYLGLVMLLVMVISMIVLLPYKKPASTQRTPAEELQAKADSVLGIILDVQGKYANLIRDAHNRDIQDSGDLQVANFQKKERVALQMMHATMQNTIRDLELVNPRSGTSPDTLIIVYSQKEADSVDPSLGGWVYIPRYLSLKPNLAAATDIRAKRPGEK